MMGKKMPVRKTHNQFIHELKAVNPNIEVLGQYKNSATHIECKCTACANIWNPTPNDLLRGHGCPKCRHKLGAERRVIPHDVFVERVKNKKPQIEILGIYVNAKTAIKCRCKICGHIWYPKAGAVLYSNNGCPACSHSSTSFIEQVIFLAFAYALPDCEVSSRNRSLINSELDVYVKELKVAIEYGSYVWHRHNLKKDKDKQEECREKGIRLIRIYDSCNTLLDGEDIIVYEEDLSESHEKIKGLVNRLFFMLEITRIFSEEEWDDIFNKAYLLSRKMTTEEFEEKIKVVNPDVTILGEYKGNHRPIKVKCNHCGRIWNPTPHGLISGYGCIQCHIDSTRTSQKEFEEKVRAVNPEIVVLGKYKKASDPIKCQCLKCGRTWEPLAKNLLKAGCITCSLEKRGKRYRKTHEEFIEVVSKVNPTVEVLGRYKGNHDRVECKCKICEKIWYPIAYNLEKGHACNSCISKRRKIQNYVEGKECSEVKRGNKHLTHDEFVSIMHEVNDSIEILGKYERSNKKILCRCKICGNVWEANPYQIKNGSQCKKCSHKKHSEYMKNRDRIIKEKSAET